jgi:hypothetical protein
VRRWSRNWGKGGGVRMRMRIFEGDYVASREYVGGGGTGGR